MGRGSDWSGSRGSVVSMEDPGSRWNWFCIEVHMSAIAMGLASLGRFIELTEPRLLALSIGVMDSLQWVYVATKASVSLLFMLVYYYLVLVKVFEVYKLESMVALNMSTVFLFCPAFFSYFGFIAAFDLQSYTGDAFLLLLVHWAALEAAFMLIRTFWYSCFFAGMGLIRSRDEPRKLIPSTRSMQLPMTNKDLVPMSTPGTTYMMDQEPVASSPMNSQKFYLNPMSATEHDSRLSGSKEAITRSKTSPSSRRSKSPDDTRKPHRSKTSSSSSSSSQSRHKKNERSSREKSSSSLKDRRHRVDKLRDYKTDGHSERKSRKAVESLRSRNIRKAKTSGDAKYNNSLKIDPIGYTGGGGKADMFLPKHSPKRANRGADLPPKQHQTVMPFTLESTEEFDHLMEHGYVVSQICLANDEIGSEMEEEVVHPTSAVIFNVEVYVWDSLQGCAVLLDNEFGELVKVSDHKSSKYPHRFLLGLLGLPKGATAIIVVAPKKAKTEFDVETEANHRHMLYNVQLLEISH